LVGWEASTVCFSGVSVKDSNTVVCRLKYNTFVEQKKKLPMRRLKRKPVFQIAVQESKGQNPLTQRAIPLVALGYRK